MDKIVFLLYTRGNEPQNTIPIHVFVETAFTSTMDEPPQLSKGTMGIWLTQCGYLDATIH